MGIAPSSGSGIDIIPEQLFNEGRKQRHVLPQTKAAFNGDLDEINRLLDEGMDPNVAEENGLTPLLAASEAGHLPVVLRLLEKNADARHAGGNHNGTALHQAALSGDVKIAIALLAAGANPAATTDNGVTPLILASRAGSNELVDILLNYETVKASVNQATTDKGTTALHMAAYFGRLTIAKRLLAAGANPVAATTDMGMTPLMNASAAGRDKLVEILLEIKAVQDSVNQRMTDDGATALHMAAQNGHIAVAKRLLAAGANPVAAATDIGVTPLMLASENGSDQVIEILLEIKAVQDSVNQGMTDDGATALHMAAQEGHAAVAKKLLAAGANPVAATTDKGVTPLMHASISGCDELVEILLEIEAVRTGINQVTLDNGVTALHLAAQNHDAGIAKNLLAAGADPSLLTKDNLSARDIAFTLQRHDVVEALDQFSSAKAATTEPAEQKESVSPVRNQSPTWARQFSEAARHRKNEHNVSQSLSLSLSPRRH